MPMRMNRWVGIGCLAEDMKFTPKQDGRDARATGRLIINRPAAPKEGVPNYDTIPLVAWGKHAENLHQFASEGKELGIEGRIRTNSVVQPNGERKDFWEIVVDYVSFGHDSAAGRVLKAIQAGAPAVRALLKEEGDAVRALIRNNPALYERVKKLAQGRAPAAPKPVTPSTPEATSENPFLE